MSYRFETLQIHAGQSQRDAHNKACAVPIYQTAAYHFDDADHAARLFALQEFGNIYSRIMNPTNDVLEQRIAALETGVAALAVASGHAAEFIALTNLADAGDNIISSPNLYGGSANLFKNTLPRLGIEVRFVGSDDRPEDYARLIDDKTKAIYCETIPNPSLALPDLDAIAAVAHAAGVAVVVDNTSGMAGYLYRPLQHGANVVIHSATKWINGHGTGIGGLIVDGGNFDWNTPRYPGFSQPNPSYHGVVLGDAFGVNSPVGNIAFVVRARVEGLRDIGAALSPHSASLFLQGLETLSLRAERHIHNTEALAQWLLEHPHVVAVHHPSLSSSPYHARAQQHYPRGAGAFLTFEVAGGREAGKAFLNQVKLASHLVNLGDAKTSVSHPASTTHSQLDEAQLQAVGIGAGTIRVAVGLEHIDDLLADFSQALDFSQQAKQATQES